MTHPHDEPDVFAASRIKSPWRGPPFAVHLTGATRPDNWVHERFKSAAQSGKTLTQAGIAEDDNHDGLTLEKLRDARRILLTAKPIVSSFNVRNPSHFHKALEDYVETSSRRPVDFDPSPPPLFLGLSGIRIVEDVRVPDGVVATVIDGVFEKAFAYEQTDAARQSAENFNRVIKAASPNAS